MNGKHRGWALSLLLTSVTACGGRPPPEAASTPPTVPTAEAQVPVRAGDPFVVSNQCNAAGEDYSLHARIDAEHIGGEKPVASRFVWSITCHERECRGSRVELDAWLAKRPLGPSGLDVLDKVEFVEGTASAFVLRWGPRTFRIDMSRSEVVYEESGVSRQRGAAPCSANGVAWAGGQP